MIMNKSLNDIHESRPPRKCNFYILSIIVFIIIFIIDDLRFDTNFVTTVFSINGAALGLFFRWST